MAQALGRRGKVVEEGEWMRDGDIRKAPQPLLRGTVARGEKETLHVARAGFAGRRWDGNLTTV